MLQQCPFEEWYLVPSKTHSIQYSDSSSNNTAYLHPVIYIGTQSVELALFRSPSGQQTESDK